MKPTLSEYFKPALLARMTVVPYVPIRPEALDGIVRMKLGAVAARAQESHKVALSFDDSVIAAIAERCREVESGARNVNHILRGSILPLVSQHVLGALAEGGAAHALRLTVGGDGNFQCTEIA